MFRDTNIFQELPPAVGGYELDPYKGFFSIVVPNGIDKTNLITNPSFELGTTGYAVTNGTFIQDSTQQRRGIYSGKWTPTSANSDVYSPSVSLILGTTYYVSMDVLAPAGARLFLAFTTTGQVIVGQAYSFTATGSWQRVSLAYSETASLSRLITIGQSGSANRSPIWIDGVQIEQDTLTTYIDGDQPGFVPNRADYYWAGVPHASASVRLGQSRAGGRLIALSDYGFHLNAILGLGYSGKVNSLLNIASGGASYQGTISNDRQFSLVGMLYGNTLPDLQRRRKALIDAFKNDLVSPDQTFKLIYQQFDDDGNAVTLPQEIICLLDGDPLSGRTDNKNAEALALTFRIITTYTSREVGESSISLGMNIASAGTAVLIAFAPNGAQWNNIGTGITGGTTTVQDVLYNPYDGRFYVAYRGGAFNGVASTAGIAAYDPIAGTVSALGAGCTLAATGGALCLALAPNGDVIAAGNNITNFGGVANTQNIARWSLASAAWQSIATTGTGLIGNTVNALAVYPDGTIVAGGTFANMGGVAAVNIAYRTPAGVWTAMSTGANSTVTTLAIGKDNNTLYIGGVFTALGAVVCSCIGSWSKSALAFVSMGTGATGPGLAVYGLAVGANGLIYVVGSFTALNGISANGVGSWNGTQFVGLSSGISGVGANLATAVYYDNATGLLHIGGTFTVIGGVSVPNNYAIWNGSVFLPPDILLPTTITTIGTNPRGDRLAGLGGSGTLTSAAFTSLVNNGNSQAGTRISITGPGTLYQIKNLTNNKILALNLTFIAGEIALLDISENTLISFVSNFRGNLLNLILGGSNVADFVLLPGTNLISVLYTGTTAASVVAMLWRNTYNSIDAAIPVNLNL